MLTKTVFLLASVIGLANCQLNISAVPLSTRDQWCQDQESSCPLICLQLPGANGPPESNTCSPITLDYSCVCSNGVAPNASEYTQTMPFFICTEINNQCVSACGSSDSACQSACRDNHPCGAQDPKRINVTATATKATAASTSLATNVVYTGFGSSSTSTGTPKKGAASRALALELGQAYGLVLLVGGFFAGFAALV